MRAVKKSPSQKWSKVDEALSAACHPYPDPEGKPEESDRMLPGAVLLVGQGGGIAYHKAFGCRSLVPEVTPMQTDTVFDVASLTKVVVSVPLIMRMVDRGLLDVEHKLSRVFQTFGTHGKERMTVRHLLTHTSGYPDTFPYYRQIATADRGERSGMMTTRGAVEAVYREIFRGKLDNLPGKVVKYSDIGFLLLGHVAEVVGGMNFDKLALRFVFEPLKLYSTGFIDLEVLRRQGIEAVPEAIAPTAYCPWRKKLLCGQVHDDNAWAMGGVAAHAGVFTTALDLHRFSTHMIDCWHGRGGLFSRDVLRLFWKRDTAVAGNSWALGWDTPKRQGSSSGQYFTSTSVGHLGYTGCSLWIDPEREITVALLTNRVHPDVSQGTEISSFRPYIHDLVMEALKATS